MKPLFALVVLFSLALRAAAADPQPAPSSQPSSPLPELVITDRTAEPLLKAERPWESFLVTGVRVIRVGDVWHMWYSSYDAAYRNDGDYYFCYARSADGVRWERPNLGFVEYGGSRDNNIAAKGAFGSCVFLDPGAPAGERFKCVYTGFVGGEWHLFGATSPDGIRWTRLPQPLMRRNTDTDNVCIPEPDGRYRFYVRMWTGGTYRGTRVVGYTESRAFAGPLPEPRVILAPDGKDPGDLHFYNSAAAKLGDALYVMFPSGYTTSDELARPHLAVSRDGTTFSRVGRGPVLELGQGFDSAGVYAAAAPVPAERPGEFWFYYNGTRARHNENVPGKFKYNGGFGRFRVKVVERSGR